MKKYLQSGTVLDCPDEPKFDKEVIISVVAIIVALVILTVVIFLSVQKINKTKSVDDNGITIQNVNRG